MTSNIHEDGPCPSESGPPAPGRRLLVVCDFDGTVCRVDMGNLFLERFAREWEEIDRSYLAGKVGSREAYRRIAPQLRGNRREIMDFVVRNERLDSFFPGFLGFCQDRGIALKIVSDGLDFYIDAILRKHGLDLECYSNRLLFLYSGTFDIDFPEANGSCGLCGTCKRSLLYRFRGSYERIVYVGDGYSDFCAVGAADLVFAKPILHAKCVEMGTPCVLFKDFSDVRNVLERSLAAGGTGHGRKGRLDDSAAAMDGSPGCNRRGREGVPDAPGPKGPHGPAAVADYLSTRRP